MQVSNVGTVNKLLPTTDGNESDLSFVLVCDNYY